MSEAPAPIGDAVLDGWALAAALGGSADAVEAAAPAFASRLRDRLAALADPQRKGAALRAWSRRVAPAIDAATLKAATPRLRALLAPLASAATRAQVAAELEALPSPRRGYRPPPGLAEGLAARWARRSTPPTDADRGRGRRALAALGEEASELLANAGPEADAVARLEALGGGEPSGDPIVPFALAAAKGHSDPVGRFGQLLAEDGAAARELRELEVACRE